MNRFLKQSIVGCVSMLLFFSCQKDASSGGGNSGSGTTTRCRVDKIQSYGLISTTQPVDFFFIYDSDKKLTQINGVSNTANISRAKFYYTGTNINKVETYSLGSSLSLELNGYLELTYSGNDIIQMKRYEKTGTTFKNTTTHDYSYDASGRRNKKVIKTAYGSAPLTLSSTSTYTYDGSDNIIKVEEREANGQLEQVYNYEYNNKLNPAKSYSSQIDAFGWAFFDGNGDYYFDNGLTDAKYLSKYQMVKFIWTITSGGGGTYNYAYTYDSDGKITQITSSNWDINKALITYQCN